MGSTPTAGLHSPARTAVDGRIEAHVTVRKAIAWIAFALILSSCAGSGESGPPVEPARGASGSVENVALQAADVPDSMVRCNYSAAIGAYIENVNAINPAGGEAIGGTWAQLQAAGAMDGWITVFADSVPACQGWVAAGEDSRLPASARVVSSVVMRFGDPPAAEAGYRADIFKQSLLDTVPRLRVVRGAATKLGPNAVIGSDEQVRPAVHQAVWQKNAFNVFTLGRELTRTEFDAVVTAMDGRIP